MVLAGAIWVNFRATWVFCSFLQKDTVDTAYCDTLSQLDNYVTRPEETVVWLTTYHGEAQGTADMMALIEWALSHEVKFLELLSRVGENEIGMLLLRLSDAVVQSGRVQIFRETFERRKAGSERLRILLSAVSDPTFRPDLWIP